MPNHLSTLGIIHTTISIIALLVAFYALYREGKINPQSGAGKLYTWLTIITCVTGFPIMKTGHLTPGHYLAIIIVLLLPLGIYAGRIFGKIAPYVQVVLMSATLFLSLIPAVVETLTRIPLDHPIAGSPNDPIVAKALAALFGFFTVGIIYQLVKLRQQLKRV
jgi:hypothetical protein